MPEFLSFTLAAPLAAMGDLAVGERRGTWDRPARSAILGLIAACLGIDRDDEDAHHALERGYRLALRMERLGPIMADYHTAQMPSAKRGRRFATRAEELSVADLNTVLTRRDYRTDTLAFIAMWPDPQPQWSLTEIATALRAPQYVTYVGRKSCPLMLPLAPRLTDAADPVAALEVHAQQEKARGLLRSFYFSGSPTITLDAADAAHFGLHVRRVELRRDRIASRRRWQFALREEAVLEQP
jgi:CRISPR system Cascade subunit CasD